MQMLNLVVYNQDTFNPKPSIGKIQLLQFWSNGRRLAMPNNGSVPSTRNC